MYLNILKKDLKRKKTMNVILLVFVLLSAMFMGSSANNIIAVTTGLDFFFEKADMADYFVIALDNGNEDLVNELNSLDSVSGCSQEEIIIGSGNNIEYKGESLKDYNGTPLFMSVDDAKLNYFTPNNEEITEVEKGKVYIGGPFTTQNNLKVGDMLTVTIGESEVELEYMGRAKDALFGSDMVYLPKFIMNNEDFEHLCNDEEAENLSGSILYIDTTNSKEVKDILSEHQGIMFEGTKDYIKVTYIMSVVIAGLLLVVSVFLIIISFVVLKYTIGFTIAEEFREIGVMKAIGMKNNSIRGLYLIKYFAITITGSVLGFFAGMPFSTMMLKAVSSSMYLKSENSVLISALCSLAVIGLTLLFCWSSTSKIKKLTPIDAVRNGTTGERFRKKSIMHLSKNKLGSTAFLAANDIVSAPKKYSIITVVFSILILLVMVLANTVNTFNSDKLIPVMGATASDVYISSSALGEDISRMDEKGEEDLEKVLAENNMPGKVHAEYIYTIGTIVNDEKTPVKFLYCPDTKASDYVYSEGVAPENADEIALTYIVADQLGVGIGDKITLIVDVEEKECIITALFQCMVNTGLTCRLHEDFDISTLEPTAKIAYQIDFDDEITEEECADRIERLKEIYDTENVYNIRDYIKTSTGVADTLAAIKNMVLIITLVIVVLIAVLMERSFISAEKAEIALMKAIGFSNKSVIWHHTLRFAIVAAIASLIAAAICLPVTKLVMDPVMAIVGATAGVGYEIVPFEIFVVYPVIMVAVTIISAFFTSIYTNTIKSSDASNIE